MKKILLFIFICTTIKSGYSDACYIPPLEAGPIPDIALPPLPPEVVEEERINAHRRKMLEEFVHSDFSRLTKRQKVRSRKYLYNSTAPQAAEPILLTIPKPTTSTDDPPPNYNGNDNPDEEGYTAQCSKCSRNFRSEEMRNLKKSIGGHYTMCMPSEEISIHDPSVFFRFLFSCPRCKKYHPSKTEFLGYKRVAIERVIRHINSQHSKRYKPKEAKKYVTITRIVE